MPYALDSGEDALFDLETGAITLHSRGGTKGKGNARNTEYGPALREILRRMLSAGIEITDAYVDSSQVQSLPISERRIVVQGAVAEDPGELFTLMSRRMEQVDQSGPRTRGSSTRRIRIELGPGAMKSRLVEVLRAVRVDRDTRSADRLRAEQMRKVTADQVWAARERLLDQGTYAPFEDSTDYDVVLEDGRRLPPKALLGTALTEALGFQVLPRHFSGGPASTCFKILREFDYKIVPKASAEQAEPEQPPQSAEDQEWAEGGKKRVWHLRAERKSGLSKAKREQFKRQNKGRLFCERCGFEPVKEYDTELAESCIEVHHAKVAIADMTPDHKTQLEDLQCLCANCHRLVHREIREVGEQQH